MDASERIRELEEANKALLDGHGKIATAYLCLRVKNVEDDNARLSKEVLQLRRLVETLRDEQAKTLKQLELAREAFRDVRDETGSRLDALEGNGNGKEA